jgi:hypothetical protein
MMIGYRYETEDDDDTLVRQRSWVQIPAKASLFGKKDEESGFFLVVSVLPGFDIALYFSFVGIGKHRPVEYFQLTIQTLSWLIMLDSGSQGACYSIIILSFSDYGLSQRSTRLSYQGKTK